MIELVCGLVFGIGLVLALSPWFTPPRTSAPWRPGKRLRQDVARARVPGLSAARLVVLSLILGAIVALVVLAVTGAWPVALIVSVGVAFLPYAWVVSRVAARQDSAGRMARSHRRDGLRRACRNLAASSPVRPRRRGTRARALRLRGVLA